MSNSVHKFLFGNVFDGEHPDRDVDLTLDAQRRAAYDTPPPPPPEPTFTAEQMQAAHTDGYTQGQAAGYAAGQAAGAAEAQARQKTMLTQALARIAEGVGRLITEREATNLMRQRQPLRLTLAIARKLLPEMARRSAMDEIEGMVKECLRNLIDEPRLMIRVNDILLEDVKARLDGLPEATGFTGKLLVLGDPGLAPGDCRVEWAEGGAERNNARLLEEIERVAQRVLAAS